MANTIKETESEIWDVLDENGNKTGKLFERGNILEKGEYHLFVYVWIINSNNEFLISKRAPNKESPNMWECTGGSAASGDDSITTAQKEVKEELGIELESKNGQLFKRYKRDFPSGSGAFVDVWVFRQNVDLSTVVLNPEETCDAMLAGKDKIIQMMKDKTFIYEPYFEEVLQFAEEL